MQLNELKPNHRRKRDLRVGRGGKRGTTSGRGQKGQKARSGHRLPRAEREMILKFPKARGIKNKPLSDRAVVISIGALADLAKNGKLTRAILLEQGIIPARTAKVKILGGGKIQSAIIVESIPVSASAKKAIEAAGGSVK